MKLLNTTIGDSPLVISDGNYSSKYPKKDEFLAEGVPFISANNLKDGHVVWENMKFISHNQHATLKKGHLQHGDVLLVTRGSLGLSAYVSNEFVGANINAQIVLLRADNKAIDSRYLYFVVSSQPFFDSVISFSSGTAQPQLPVGALKKIPFSYPDITTQRKIAGVLSAYDDLIENNTRRIAILEEMAQAIYREWFVNFRFPGHEKVKLLNSPLGKIPEGWKASPLSDIADVNALSVKKGKEPDKVNYVDIASVSTSTIDEVRLLPFSEAPGRARRIVRHGDLIWSTVRPNRKSYSLILNPLPNMIVSTGFAVISGTKAPFSYLYHALTTDEFVGYLVNHATGSAYPAVNSGDFEKATILVPSQDVLAAFHEATEPMFLAQHCMAEKNKKLRASRDLLLPKLISGQLDVEELDIETGELLMEAES